MILNFTNGKYLFFEIFVFLIDNAFLLLNCYFNKLMKYEVTYLFLACLSIQQETLRHDTYW